MFLRSKKKDSYICYKDFYGLSYDISIEIYFRLKTAKTCRLFLDECINYLITIIKTFNIYVHGLIKSSPQIIIKVTKFRLSLGTL